MCFFLSNSDPHARIWAGWGAEKENLLCIHNTGFRSLTTHAHLASRVSTDCQHSARAQSSIPHWPNLLCDLDIVSQCPKLKHVGQTQIEGKVTQGGHKSWGHTSDKAKLRILGLNLLERQAAEELPSHHSFKLLTTPNTTNTPPTLHQHTADSTLQHQHQGKTRCQGTLLTPPTQFSFTLSFPQ